MATPCLLATAILTKEMEGTGGLERKVKVRFSRFFLWAVA